MMTDEIEVYTGNVTLTIYDSDDKPVRNSRVSLSKNNEVLFEEYSDRLGECLIEDVTYDTYTLKVSHTGYVTVEDTLTVDDATITDTITLTHQPVDPNVTEVDLDEIYTFTITGQVQPEYSMSTQISNWLQTNLSSLTDDYNTSLFGKVNLGFSDESLRTFGKKPVCDVYIDNIAYSTDFDAQVPFKVNTMVLYYFKGANTPVYSKACQLHDLLMQEFLTNEEWQRSTLVRSTSITNSEIRIQPLGKKWGVIGAFQLSHDLY